MRAGREVGWEGQCDADTRCSVVEVSSELLSA